MFQHIGYQGFWLLIREEEESKWKSALDRKRDWVFWDSRGPGSRWTTSSNDQYNADLFRQLRDNIKAKRSGKLAKGVLFHLDIDPDSLNILRIHHI